MTISKNDIVKAVQKIIAASAPKDIKSIWDAGEEGGLDRYTVIFDPKHGWDAGPGMFMSLGFGAGKHQSGISQWGDAKEGKHLGKKLKWKDLPKESQDHILRRMKE